MLRRKTDARENKRQVNETVVDICSTGRAEVSGEGTPAVHSNDAKREATSAQVGELGGRTATAVQ